MRWDIEYIPSKIERDHRNFYCFTCVSIVHENKNNNPFSNKYSWKNAINIIMEFSYECL